ncbi:MAG: hypothetical protein ACD_30C00100G0005 [uncultured bacterium]|uniref:DUF5667 domain-containing protein n=4 Tax=Candidatus Daviesiibacteriota TaxID=1752718 RepID=A0A0G0ENR7_9BACT|nr:MAG: hypothetical protein ACD_30C00100G0005 [uncultured bacterium]KKQ08618.1 MAG: hypothetical protein US19_C0021G0034 [Candidatus Daviesbacteria bacterium GW2011_GWB1_36_5]KKQ16354.1 MAG: hypothetical protein US28_C0002G0021 [Candidatus Daviesbacteria bacterium GW2011_GWA1_36_8]OGE16369.1 MAG: hypothetical protein A2858_04165 [Candidatus Daviesbacteria bacterium RIFCSPHIGHO2_01_FULL_36_37]OGE35642.1 MAG: hypothetical protein A3E66_04305 [Candidatus Daviesbacteria bacterium RIFCSPHIGHO2_12_F
MSKILPAVIFLLFLILTPTIQARTTPEDIVNAKKQEYNQRLQNYSPESKQKLADFERKIADLNKLITDDYETQMLRHGTILDEYIRRNEISERQGDGISRNLSEPVENSRYWITYAHEAVAYQAAKIYIPSLTGETNINRDITSQINILQSDINILRGKVTKSKNILMSLLKK